MITFTSPANGKKHFFGDHPEGLNVNSPFKGFIKAFHTIDPNQYGIEIMNATEQSALTCFPKANLKDVLCSQTR